MALEGDNVAGASDWQQGIEDPRLRAAAADIRGLSHRVLRQKQARLAQGILGISLYPDKLMEKERKLNIGHLAHFLLSSESLVFDIPAKPGSPTHKFYKSVIPEDANNQKGTEAHVLAPAAFELFASSSGEADKQVDRLSIITVYSAAALAVREVLHADVVQPGSLEIAPVRLSREIWIPDPESFVPNGTVLQQTAPEEVVADEAQAFAVFASSLYAKRSSAGGSRYQ